jgi:hypothetical protein
MKILIIVSTILVILAFLLTQRLRVVQAAPGNNRVVIGLVALYELMETEGDIIHDGTGSLDLTIRDPENFEWLNPGIKVFASTVAKTDNAKMAYMPYVTIEAWVKPANNTQSGPARIVTFSKDSAERNFTLGQIADKYDVRFRTSENSLNGTNPSTPTPPGDIKTPPTLQHVVYTRDVATGMAKIYVDRYLCNEVSVPGDGSNWDVSFGLGLFNEINYPIDDRTWLGEIRLVAIYDRVLSQGEINQNYYAGPPGELTRGSASVTVAWDANVEPDLAGYRIYLGVNPGDYVRMDDVGDVTEYEITGLLANTTYYIAATAYDDDDNESAYSKELVHETGAWDDPESGKGLKHKPLPIEW